MSNNQSGKILVVFLIIVAILLISLTGISMFFFQMEIDKRKVAEQSLQDSIANGIRLEGDLKDVKKKNFLLEEKNKEADERINSILDELELEEGIREEMKQEITTLKEEVETQKKENRKLFSQVEDYKTVEDKIAGLEARLKSEIRARENLEKVNQELEKQVFLSEQSVPEQRMEPATPEVSMISEEVESKDDLAEESPKIVQKAEKMMEKEVKLEPIVVSPRDLPEGRILSVDKDTEFVIINLGSKDGLESGMILSVERGDEYLGDIQISRVQPEMSAADLIPPFSSQVVRKNDQVVAR